MHYHISHSGIGSLNAAIVFRSKKQCKDNPPNKNIVVEYQIDLPFKFWFKSSVTKLNIPLQSF
jgi:hypothetical protein